MQLESKLFERRNFHWMGDERRGSLEKLRWRRRNVPRILLCVSMLCGLPGLMLFAHELAVDFSNHPMGLWTFLLFIPMLLVGIPTFAQFLEYRSIIRECDVRGFGYWILHKANIVHHFGIDPPHTLPLSTIRGVRLNKQKSQIFLETTEEPMVITCRIRSKPASMPILPFLNSLVERLEKFDLDISPLRDLQDELRKGVITREVEPRAALVDLFAFAGFPLASMFLILIIDGSFLRHGDFSPLSRLGIMLGMSVLFLGTIPIGLKIGRVVRQRRDRRIEEKYRDILSKPREPLKSVQIDSARPLKFAVPPRTITDAARRRLLFGWYSVFGGVALPLFCLFLLFLIGVNPARDADESLRNSLVGLFGVSMLALLGFAFLLYDWQRGKLFADLYENGIAVKSRIHEIGPMNIVVKTAPRWGGLVKVSKEDTLPPLSSGDRIILFVDPQNPKRRFILEQSTGAVSYDADANSFDSQSKLPTLRFPAVILFGAMSIFWLVLLVRELMRFVS